MTHFYKSLALMAAAAFIAPQAASAADTMNPATLEYPNGYYCSMVPGSIDLNWNAGPIELIDPKTDELGDPYVEVSLKINDDEPVSANAYLMYLESFDEDQEDEWLLEVALYDVEDLWDVSEGEIIITLPEGIVKNGEGLLNPKQELTFYLVESFTDYTVTPDTGSTIAQADAVIKVSFGDNSIEYLDGEVSAFTYEPSFQELNFAYGKEVSISENKELVVDLTSLQPGDFEIVIPEGLLIVKDGDQNYISPDIWLEYSITETDGVKTVDVKKGNSPIFNLNGVKVGQTDGSKVKPGIYIIDGKKVILK